MVVWDAVGRMVHRRVRVGGQARSRSDQRRGLAAQARLQVQQALDEIRRMILAGKTDSPGEVLLSNLRHKQAIEKARQALNQALESLLAGLSAEFISVDLQEAQAALGEIVGTHTSEDILERIFSRFCVGK